MAAKKKIELVDMEWDFSLSGNGAPQPREKNTASVKGFTPLTIEEINQFKPRHNYRAIRFDNTIITTISRNRQVVCLCGCGNYFRCRQERILDGTRQSCGCRRKITARQLSIIDINNKKPVDSKLIAIEIYPVVKEEPHKKCLCVCECGNKIIINICSVTTGNTKSCGCWRKPRKYSVTIKTLRTCYTDMIGRCYNQNFENYRIYGAKGVLVCKEWRESYQAFLDWSLANGWKPGLVLDKDIKGNGKLYSPNTCTWTTQLENANYTSRSRIFNYNGEVLTIAQIAKKLNVKDYRLRNFISYGYSLEESIKKVA